MQNFFENIGLKVPEIYLPNSNVDLNKWAVVACDQYTSQQEYREEVANYIWEKPSTFNIIYPEVYLEESKWEERINNIKSNMNKYLQDGTLENKWYWFIYIDRSTSHALSRKWLVVALDLEKYDYSKTSQTLIRATEWTILDRLPPRIKIREWANLESPHIMVLIDDLEKQVIEPLSQNLDKYQKLYDFDLMMEWWHITWYQISDEETINKIAQSLTNLMDKNLFKNKYWVADDLWVLLFAMWDWNHSFATAKAIWEEKKKTLTEEQKIDHPARFALVELNNVHDAGINFEPIHRVLFGVDWNHFFPKFREYLQSIGSELIVENYMTKEELTDNLKESTKDVHYFRWMNQEWYVLISIKNPKFNLEVWSLQNFLNKYLEENKQVKVDYVHWEDVTEQLWRKKDNLWLILPIMHKSDFFKTVIVDWALPRKTFSMWESEEKRFYLECRKINW